jgi:hypothetical protein
MSTATTMVKVKRIRIQMREQYHPGQLPGKQCLTVEIVHDDGFSYYLDCWGEDIDLVVDDDVATAQQCCNLPWLSDD